MIPSTLDQATTPSFDAYRRYVEGIKLQEKGDGVGSNRVLREALALDTGFASAWYVMGWNFMNDRMLDSARLAFAEAVRRPDRLGIPRLYRVEADAAYAIRYDLEAAVRAYDLYLQHFSQSFSVLNNRGLYLLALGRYDDALRDFERGVAVHPFGRAQAQIPLMNEVATQIALGRLTEARASASDLTGPFATYIRLLMATATGDWAEADSVASLAAGAPSAPTWLRAHPPRQPGCGSKQWRRPRPRRLRAEPSPRRTTSLRLRQATHRPMPRGGTAERVCS